MRRTPLKAMSNKRRAALPERARIVAATHERSGHRCQFWSYAWGDEGVQLPATPGDLHGVPGQCSPGLERLNTVSLCRAHHAWVTDNPAQALIIGLHGKSS